MTSKKPDLRLDWVSSKAAIYAVERWHYSRVVPASRYASIGVWEGGAFIGAVLFSHGASWNLGHQYGLAESQCIELVRVALTTHRAPVSRICSIACKMFLRLNPGIELIVSFADPNQGHAGTIYQAMGWTYAGQSAPTTVYWLNGRKWHIRCFTAFNFGKPPKKLPADAIKLTQPGKLKYLHPVSPRMVEHVKRLALPYPKLLRSEGVSPLEGPGLPGQD